MSAMSDWHDKEDLDLTSDDIGAMLDAGEPARAGRPTLPGSAILVSAIPTHGMPPATAVRSPWAPTARVSQPLTRC